MPHEKYFSILHKIAEAQDAAAGKRLSALLVMKNDIVAVGHNKMKTHPFQKQFASMSDALFLHAETDTILNALRSCDTSDLAKTTMYVLRLKRPDTHSKTFIRGMAKPCVGCQRCISTFGIKNVFYTTDNGYDCL